MRDDRRRIKRAPAPARPLPRAAPPRAAAWLPLRFILHPSAFVLTIPAVGLYGRFVFPVLADAVMSGRALMEQRRLLLSRVSGSVLEIGFGTGLNLECYGPGVTRLTAVEPNAGMSRRARR